jgi:hypothetical protein
MLLLSSRPRESASPDVWTAQAEVPATAEQALRTLTDPAAIADWAPVSFDVEGLAGGRLRAGSRARVSGAIAGLRATFDVDVIRADTRLLELVAHGPVSFEVTYRFRPCGCGLLVDARVAVPRRGGLTAQLVRSATVALLNAGALGASLRRLERSISATAEPELAAA